MITTVQENLAKLMSNEDITVIQQPVKTAYFDTVKRVLVIPNWENLSDIIIELLIGHEIGHALYTNSEEWIAAITLREPSGVFRDYLNVVEDARIESLVKQRYPGMKKIFYHGYAQILETKIMTIDDVSDLPLIDRLNVYFKFNGQCTLSLSAREENYIRKIESVRNFKDVIDIALEIFDSELHENKKHDINISPQKMELGDSPDLLGEVSYKSTDIPSNELESDANKNLISTKTEADLTDDKQKESPKISDSPEAPKTPAKSQTLRDLDNSLSDIVNISAEAIVYVDIPSPILKNIIYPFESIKQDFDNRFASSHNKQENDDIQKETEFSDDSILDDSEFEQIFGKTGTSLSSFYSEHRNNISLHKQLFQMRQKADVHNKTMTFRTGSLDMNKLYSHKYNDQIFKTFEVRPNGKNHGLIFIMDLSGSMGKYLREAKTKALELILFCKQIGIPFVLYGFIDSMNVCYEHNGIMRRPKIFDTDIGKNDYTFDTDPNFRLLELLSSRMSDSNFKCMVDIFMNHIGITMHRLGGTPLSETHLCLDSLVTQFRQDCHAKIVNVVYFTDGSSPNKSILNKERIYPTDQYAYPKYRSKFIIHDPKTKQNHYLSDCNNGCSSKEFLKIIKTRMKDVTVINFLITFDLMNAITVDQRIKCLTEMGFSSEEIQSMSFSNYVQRTSHEAATSKYIVIEQLDMESFDTAFVCSTEMFRKPKTKSTETTLSVAENFCKTASRNKRVNIMISKFIDLIV